MENLDSLIEKADLLLREKRPEYYAQLQPGATDEELKAAESYYGFPLPAELKTLYRWKNGQDIHCYKSFTGIDNLSFSPLEDAMESHQIFKELDEAGEYEEGFWSDSWVPFLANGGGDHICMEVTPDGKNAGLLWFFHDDDIRRQPELWSIEEILKAAIEEMECAEEED